MKKFDVLEYCYVKNVMEMISGIFVHGEVKVKVEVVLKVSVVDRDIDYEI